MLGCRDYSVTVPRLFDSKVTGMLNCGLFYLLLQLDNPVLKAI
jgi:hypothetical protein